jgi:hypothetical protein
VLSVFDLIIPAGKDVRIRDLPDQVWRLKSGFDHTEAGPDDFWMLLRDVFKALVREFNLTVEKGTKETCGHESERSSCVSL